MSLPVNILCSQGSFLPHDKTRSKSPNKQVFHEKLKFSTKTPAKIV
ncbi:hypothetical protein B4073_2261 [Bacillus subtilis]|nr:hypothetical protein B4073_2261 [Bacillus subtilis]